MESWGHRVHREHLAWFLWPPFADKLAGTLFQVLLLFTTLSRAASRCMGGAVFCLTWMSSAVLCKVVSHFRVRLVERKCCSVEQEDLPRPCIVQGNCLFTIMAQWTGARRINIVDVQAKKKKKTEQINLTLLMLSYFSFFWRQYFFFPPTVRYLFLLKDWEGIPPQCQIFV